MELAARPCRRPWPCLLALLLVCSCAPKEQEGQGGYWDPGGDGHGGGKVSCSLTAPGADELLAGTVTLAATCSHASGLGWVEFRVDRLPVLRLAPLPAATPYQTVYDTTQVRDGLHTLSVAAAALDGSMGESSVQVWIDNTPPTLTVTSPLAGERFVGTLPVVLAAQDDPLPGASGPTQPQPRPVAQVRLRLRDALMASVAEPDPGSPLEVQLDVAALVTGPYTLAVEAEDAAGNTARHEVGVQVVTSPHFRAVVPVPVGLGRSTSDLAVADEDGDGHLDLWFANSAGVVVRHGLGDGRFGDPVKLPPLSTGSVLLLVRDLDGDGRPELVRTTSDSKVEVLRRTAQGWSAVLETHTLAERATVLALAPVDRDPWPDLLVGGERDETCLGVLRARDPALAPPFFEEVAYAGGVTRVRSIEVADVDGDGKNDVLVGRADTVFSVFPGQGDGSFGIPRSTGPADGCAGHADGLAVGDFTEDGIPDVAVGQTEGGVLIYRGGGAQDWQFVGSELIVGYYTSLGSRQVLVTELDGDGHQDLLVVNGQAKNMSVFLGAGDGTFTEREMFNLGPSPARARLADLDADGLLDVVYLAVPGDTFAVLRGRGGGSFAGAPELRLPEDVVDIVAAPLRGHGQGMDLAAIGKSVRGDDNRTRFSVLQARNDGSYPRVPWAGTRFDITGQGSTVEARAGDPSGDGKTDLVVLTNGSCRAPASCKPTVNLLTGDGAGGLPGHLSFSLGSTPSTLALCDIDGDGKEDVVVAQPQVSADPAVITFGLVLRHEPLQLVPDGGAVLSGNPADLQCAYQNGDEATDFFTVNTLDGSLNYFKGDNASPHVQGERQVLGIGEQPKRLVIADVDGDRQQDAFASVADNLAIAFGSPGGETFDTSTFLSHPGCSPWGVAVHDFTDDGLPDLAVTNQRGSTLSIYVNAGDRQFIGPVDVHTSLAPTELVSADFNGDGCADLAALNTQTMTVTLLLAEGARCEPTP